jgi:hypothetical protein
MIRYLSRMIRRERYVRKLLQPILRHYTVIFLVAMGKSPGTSVRKQVLQARFETVTIKYAARVLITILLFGSQKEQLYV